MVLAVCRRVLGNESDAEDAFQAAFLVFVRKAASLRSRELVGPWLYGVAYRTALKARSAAARRRVQERRAATMNPTQAEPDDGWAELLPLLDRELNRLPEKYRSALVVCELEGRPRKEAARKLGVPEGTLSSRLATAKRMLARRLGCHGPASSDGTLAAALARVRGVPPSLLASTTKAAALFATGQAATAVTSAPVAALAERVLKSMLLNKVAVSVLAVIVIVASGACAFRPFAAPSSPPEPAAVGPTQPERKPPVEKDKQEWGEPVDGIQVRLRASKTAWDAGKRPELVVDVRNRGEKAPHQCRVANFCEIEWDGRWYEYGGRGELDCLSATLRPGQEIDEWVKETLDTPWVRKGARNVPLHPAAGKHTVRFAVLFDGGPRPVSQPVEIEIGKESAWGDAVGGVQARLRTPKAVWGAKEQPTFIVDLRNVGDQRPHATHFLFGAEIEADGQWYGFTGAFSGRSQDTELAPGAQSDDWVAVTSSTAWEPKAPSDGPKPLLPLASGKHTIRIAYSLTGEKGIIRPVSGPIEIEVRQ
jgi:RNA polymerase sigma factor (sigma-70 family)